MKVKMISHGQVTNNKNTIGPTLDRSDMTDRTSQAYAQPSELVSKPVKKTFFSFHKSSISDFNFSFFFKTQILLNTNRSLLFNLILPSLSLSQSLSPITGDYFSGMATSPENGTSDISTEPVIIEDEDIKFGFKREEMYTEKLTGSVNSYERHVFLCYKSHEDWPARVESSDSDPFPKRLAGAIKSRKNDFAVKTMLTICEGGDGTGLSDGDVVIFPDMIKYRGLEESNIDSFVEDVLVNGKPWALGTEEAVTGSYVFVCAHNSRDKRCGVCGPVLIEKFKEEIGVRGLKDEVFVSACSHVGGHKYAGNLIIYSAVPDGKIAGHWYGYVTPNDVPELLDQHIKKGEVIERIWRGEMGVPPVEKAEKAAEPTLVNGSDLKENSKVEKENSGGCCQGANGFSCCRDESSDAKKSTYKFDIFTRKWEQHEIFTAAAVVGAVATVAVAYSLYKRSR
ncbi:hypothetical protein QVD17_09634 [Tagetes erecta]|uniref:Altered inheritance of mitochondria protein 32 n=1 Tax=Tagetes erecta TaxID=13708 RepID=A0AAD8P5H2_TARER|nr:hypothetical protein QVD17_09634 [Tagetes erecta]